MSSKAPRDSKQTRRTQRAPQSCTMCTRKKIKCDKCTPCYNCIFRGLATQCQRESVVVNGQRSGPPKSKAEQESFVRVCLEQEYKRLGEARQRIKSLRESLGRLSMNPDEPTLEPAQSASTARAPAPDTSAGSAGAAPENLERLFTSLEQSTLVQARERESALQWAVYAPVLDSLLDLLPPKDFCLRIAAANVEQLAWKHAALIAPHFYRQQDEFWKTLASGLREVDLQWLAMYLSVLSTGVLWLSSSIFGMADEERFALSKKLYNGAVSALCVSNFTVNHSVSAVQAICILIMNAAHIGHSSSIRIMQAAAIRILSGMGIHHMLAHAEKYVLEVRLWWVLTVMEWLASSHMLVLPLHSFPYTLPPVHSDEEVALNKTTHDGQPTAYYYLVYISRVSYIRQQFKERRVLEPKMLVHHVESALRDIRALHHELPSFLRYDEVQTPATLARDTAIPCLVWQKYDIAWLFDTQMLYYSRFLYGVFLSKEQYSEYRYMCINAALKIFALEMAPVPLHWKYEWSQASIFLSAGALLAMDLVFVDEPDDTMFFERRQAVQNSRALMHSLSHTSVLRKRAVSLLDKFLVLIDKRAAARHTNRTGDGPREATPSHVSSKDRFAEFQAAVDEVIDETDSTSAASSAVHDEVKAAGPEISEMGMFEFLDWMIESVQ